MSLRTNKITPSPLVIGVAGGTGSGKTTLASALQETLGSQLCVTVSQDSYYKDLSHLEFAERATVNFDHPDSLDSDLMVEHVARLKNMQSVVLPEYDFAQHVRVGQGRYVQARSVIIVEGILVLVWESLRELMDVSVFVDAPEKVRLDRRVKRDVAERGRDVEGVLEQYYATVRPMHQEFVEPSSKSAQLVIDGEGELNHGVHSVMKHLGLAPLDQSPRVQYWNHSSSANG